MSSDVFIKIWSPEWLGCTSRQDRLDAMRVAAHLGIPFREIDLTEEYKKEVVDYMIREYKIGQNAESGCFLQQIHKVRNIFRLGDARRRGFRCDGTLRSDKKRR